MVKAKQKNHNSTWFYGKTCTVSVSTECV